MNAQRILDDHVNQFYSLLEGDHSTADLNRVHNSYKYWSQKAGYAEDAIPTQDWRDMRAILRAAVEVK